MLKRISLFAIIALVIASCSSEEEESHKERKIQDYVSASMKGNKNIVAFGSAGIKGILDKTDYQNQPLIKALIAIEMDKLNNVVRMDSPIYYTVEGPFNKEGQPKRVMLFMKVKNTKALTKELAQERGFLVEKVNGIQYAEDDEFAIGFRGDLAIVIVQQGKYSASSIMKKAFKKAQGSLSGGKVDKMLKAKGDVVVNVNVETMYGTSNTSLRNLSASNQKKIAKMAKGSFMQMKLNFNKGQMKFETENFFSKELADMMFFKTKGSSDLAQQLGKGKDGAKILGGVSANLDVRKLEKFYSTYAPEMMANASGDIEGLEGILKFIGSGGILSTLANGQVGLVSYASDNAEDMYAGTRSVVGAEEAGKKAFMLIKSEIKMPENSLFNYADGGLEFLVANEGHDVSEFSGNAKLDLPKGSDNFGKKGMVAFIDFNQLSRENMPAIQKVLVDEMDYATLEVDNKGSVLIVQMKNQNNNILKQFVDAAANNFQLLMGGG